MQKINVFKNFDDCEKEIIKALGEKSPQNPYELSNNIGYDRNVIENRINVNLNGKKKSLVDRDFVVVKTKKRTTVYEKKSISLTFKGILANIVINNMIRSKENSFHYHYLTKFIDKFEFKSAFAFYGALKLWLHYRSWINPDKMESNLSKTIERRLVNEIWNGPRYAYFIRSLYTWPAGKPQEPAPQLLLTQPTPFSLKKSFGQFGLSVKECDSLISHLDQNGFFQSGKDIFEIIDITQQKQFMKKKMKKPTVSTSGIALGGCKYVKFQIELKKSNLNQFIEKYLLEKNREYDFNKIIKNITSFPVMDFFNRCEFEDQCKIKNKNNEDIFLCTKIMKELTNL